MIQGVLNDEGEDGVGKGWWAFADACAYVCCIEWTAPGERYHRAGYRPPFTLPAWFFKVHGVILNDDRFVCLPLVLAHTVHSFCVGRVLLVILLHSCPRCLYLSI